MAAHRLDAFLPGIIVQDKIAQARMALEFHAEQILGFALMPVGGVNEFDDAGKSPLRQRRVHQHVNPAGLALAVKTVAQLPFVRSFLDNQAGKTEIPFQEKPTA